MRTRHWKKLIGLIGLFIVFFALTALCASAETEGIFTYTVANDEVIITKVDYTGVSDVVIPETIAGYPVTKLESDFLMDNDNTRGNSGETVFIPKQLPRLTPMLLSFLISDRFW